MPRLFLIMRNISLKFWDIVHFCFQVTRIYINAVIKNGTMRDWWLTELHIIVCDSICAFLFCFVCQSERDGWWGTFSMLVEGNGLLPIQHHRLIHFYDIQKSKCLILFKVTVINVFRRNVINKDINKRMYRLKCIIVIPFTVNYPTTYRNTKITQWICCAVQPLFCT